MLILWTRIQHSDTCPILQDDLMFSMRSVHQISYCPMEQRWVMFKSNMPSLSLCPNYKRHQNTPCSVSHWNALSVEEGRGFETSR